MLQQTEPHCPGQAQRNVKEIMPEKKLMEVRPVLRLWLESMEEATSQRSIFALTSRNQQILSSLWAGMFYLNLMEAQNKDNPLCLIISSPGNFSEEAEAGS